MYSIQITDKAEADLNSSIDYYLTVLKAPTAAQALIDEIEKKIAFLSADPLVYEIEYDEYLFENEIRSVLVKNHLVFYKVNKEEKEVKIIRILYARRNWQNILRKNT